MDHRTSKNRHKKCCNGQASLVFSRSSFLFPFSILIGIWIHQKRQIVFKIFGRTSKCLAIRGPTRGTTRIPYSGPEASATPKFVESIGYIRSETKLKDELLKE